MKTINERKTIRKYSTKDVSEELLNRLLTEAERRRRPAGQDREAFG
jgi:FMN reductase [NAD(P)H]